MNPDPAQKLFARTPALREIGRDLLNPVSQVFMNSIGRIFFCAVLIASAGCVHVSVKKSDDNPAPAPVSKLPARLILQVPRAFLGPSDTHAFQDRLRDRLTAAAPGTKLDLQTGVEVTPADDELVIAFNPNSANTAEVDWSFTALPACLTLFIIPVWNERIQEFTYNLKTKDAEPGPTQTIRLKRNEAIWLGYFIWGSFTSNTSGEALADALYDRLIPPAH